VQFIEGAGLWMGYLQGDAQQIMTDHGVSMV